MIDVIDNGDDKKEDDDHMMMKRMHIVCACIMILCLYNDIAYCMYLYNDVLLTQVINDHNIAFHLCKGHLFDL